MKASEAKKLLPGTLIAFADFADYESNSKSKIRIAVISSFPTVAKFHELISPEYIFEVEIVNKRLNHDINNQFRHSHNKCLIEHRQIICVVGYCNDYGMGGIVKDERSYKIQHDSKKQQIYLIDRKTGKTTVKPIKPYDQYEAKKWLSKAVFGD